MNNLYQELLGRPADPSGLANYSSQLDKGTGRDMVVREIMGGDEYHTDVVEQLYLTYLHRPADPSGLSTGVSFLDHGGTILQFRAMLLGSGEYFWGRGGGTNAGFLAALYQDALGRAVDPSGLAAYSQMLDGGTSRTGVATEILTSMEGSQYRVGMDYQWLLHRGADSNGLGTYGNQLNQGGQEEAIVVTLLSSDEFFGRR